MPIRIDDTCTLDERELEFRTSRSAGPGGQHVNRTETRVEVVFDVVRSPSLNDRQRALVLQRLRSRIHLDGTLTVAAQDHRSQLRNREAAIERLAGLLADALHVDPTRRPTKPTFASQKRRVEGKKQRSGTKRLRGRVEDGG
jgi:ribosome-associated protein